MDLGYFQKTLSKLDLREDAIKGISEFCILNSKGSEKEVARIIDNQFQTHVIEQKLAILSVISEIFIATGTKGETRFLKLIGVRVKNYFEDIARRVSDIKPECIHILPEILERWSSTVIMAPQFMEKLKNIAAPVIQAAKRIEEEKKNGIFGNYTKSFLLEYEEIKKLELTSKAYNDLNEYKKITHEIGFINQEMKKITLDANVTPQVKQRAKELHKNLEKYVSKLQDLICSIHVDIKMMRGACKEELEKLPPEAKKIYEEFKS